MTSLALKGSTGVAVSSLGPSTFGEMITFADRLAATDFVPEAYRGKPSDIIAAIVMGSELGLAPMQSLQGIAVINGRPSVWGDVMLGLVRSNPLCEDVIESTTGSGDTLEAICIAKRRGAEPVRRTFSVANAKDANLWDNPKKPLYKMYPQRMLAARARGYALRDAFPDVLRGLITAEEAIDMIDLPRGSVQDVSAPSTSSSGGQSTSSTGTPEPSQQAAEQREPKKGIVERMRDRLASATDLETIEKAAAWWKEKRDACTPLLRETVDGMIADARYRLSSKDTDKPADPTRSLADELSDEIPE